MTDGGKQQMVIYTGLSPEDQAKLEDIDDEVFQFVTNTLGKNCRAIWAGTSDGVRLSLADSSVLLDISARELAYMLRHELIAKLNEVGERPSNT